MLTCSRCEREAQHEVWRRHADGLYRKEPRCGAHLPPEPKPEPAWMSAQNGEYDSIHHSDIKHSATFPVGEYTILRGGKPE